MNNEDAKDEAGALLGCGCSVDPFAALPPEERPRGKSPMDNLRYVICPVCGLKYWTNRASDVCPQCERKKT